MRTTPKILLETRIAEVKQELKNFRLQNKIMSDKDQEPSSGDKDYMEMLEEEIKELEYLVSLDIHKCDVCGHLTHEKLPVYNANYVRQIGLNSCSKCFMYSEDSNDLEDPELIDYGEN